MRIEDNILIIDDRIEYENGDELMSLVEDVESIVVETNDIHPSILQLLFCISKDKKVVIEDEFNRRLFENLKFES
jgi:hypothetical protein